MNNIDLHIPTGEIEIHYNSGIIEVVDYIPVYTPAWLHYTDVVVPAAKVRDTLIDFPVYVDLESDLPSQAWQYIRNNGGDIRVADEKGNEKPRELVDINVSKKQGGLFIKQSELSSTNDNILRIYYDNRNAVDYQKSYKFGAQNVWVNGFASVWHMNQGNVMDSTANGNNGTNYGSSDVSGKVGKARRFDISSKISIPNSSSLTISGALTLNVWIKSSSIDSYQHIFDKGIHANYEMAISRSKIYSRITIDGILHKSYGNSDLLNNTWYNLVYRYNGITLDYFLNGITNNSDTASGKIKTSGESAVIGMENTASAHFLGIIDELRISSKPRSDEWIDAMYANQNNPSKFYDISSVNTNKQYINFNEE